MPRPPQMTRRFLKCLRAKRPSAVSELFQRFYRVLANDVRRQRKEGRGHSLDADEIAELVLVQIWENPVKALKNFDPRRGTFRNYLNFQAQDVLRRQKRTQCRRNKYERGGAKREGQSSILEDFLSVHLPEFLTKLSARDRDSFQKSYLDSADSKPRRPTTGRPQKDLQRLENLLLQYVRSIMETRDTSQHT